MHDESYWHGIDGTHFTDEQTYVIEKLYHAFKARLIEEVVVEEQITHDAVLRTPLVDTTNENTTDFIEVSRSQGPLG